MSDFVKEEYSVTGEDLEAALRVVIDYYRERKSTWALVNDAQGILISGGNSLVLESALNHAHKIQEFKNGNEYVQLEQRKEAVLQARAQAEQEGGDDPASEAGLVS